jgi:hypothetical protein
MFLLELTGRYSGTNNLILSPAEPPRPSPATASVTPVSRGKLVRLDYTWDDDGPQEGLLLVGARDGRDGVLGASTDSWHMGKKLMVFSGDIDATTMRVLARTPRLAPAARRDPTGGGALKLSEPRPARSSCLCSTSPPTTTAV